MRNAVEQLKTWLNRKQNHSIDGAASVLNFFPVLETFGDGSHHSSSFAASVLGQHVFELQMKKNASCFLKLRSRTSNWNLDEKINK